MIVTSGVALYIARRLVKCVGGGNKKAVVNH